MRRAKTPARSRPHNWLKPLERTRPADGCRRVPDSTESLIDCAPWLGGEGRDPESAAEQRAEAILHSNRGLLRDFGVEADVRRRGGRAVMALRTSSRVGALPLRSPVTGRPDFGLIIEPRFQWRSLGDVLAQTGFRVVPRLLPLPPLPQSDRHIPPWVLSSIVLARLKLLLERMSRRFVLVDAEVGAPKGSVDWELYATRSLPRAAAASVPCRFPDLRDDEPLRSAIHHVLREHRASLESQRSHGVVVRALLALCDELLGKVMGSPPRRPAPGQLAAWRHQPALSRAFAEGLEAIDWTLEERGLAGLSELAGLSWQLDMEQFFEAWVEQLAERAARMTGMQLQVGRRAQTTVGIEWEPAWSGSIGSLVPDMVMRSGELTVVLDAKYKAHAEEIERFGWRSVDEAVREHHRPDLHQALAYASLFDTRRVVTCLVYPCRPEVYASLKARHRVVSRARIPAGQRRLEVALLTAPMGSDAGQTVEGLLQVIQRPLSQGTRRAHL